MHRGISVQVSFPPPPPLGIGTILLVVDSMGYDTIVTVCMYCTYYHVIVYNSGQKHPRTPMSQRYTGRNGTIGKGKNEKSNWL